MSQEKATTFDDRGPCPSLERRYRRYAMERPFGIATKSPDGAVTDREIWRGRNRLDRLRVFDLCNRSIAVTAMSNKVVTREGMLIGHLTPAYLPMMNRTTFTCAAYTGLQYMMSPLPDVICPTVVFERRIWREYRGSRTEIGHIVQTQEWRWVCVKNRRMLRYVNGFTPFTPNIPNFYR